MQYDVRVDRFVNQFGSRLSFLGPGFTAQGATPRRIEKHGLQNLEGLWGVYPGLFAWRGAPPLHLDHAESQREEVTQRCNAEG